MKKPNLKAPKLNVKRPEFPAGGLPGGSRTTQSLLAAAAVLAVVAGIAALRPPVNPSTASHGGAVTTAQVERTQLVCPEPRQGVTGSTTLTMFAPGGGSATGGSAVLNNVTPQAAAQPAAPDPSASASAAPAAGGGDAKLSLAKTGVPATGRADDGDNALGTVATASGAYAPGFTVTQTTVTDPKNGGLSGVSCTPSGTNFWFAGISTSASRTDNVVLVNADTIPAVVDLRLYGPQGPIENDTMTGIAVAPGTSEHIALNTVANNIDDLAVNVVARSGRVGAFAHAIDSGKGRDWLPASTGPAPTQTIPGLPADLASARLIIAAPGQDDADLKVQISGKNGWFTPVIAGHENATIHIKAGMVTALDLGLVTRNSEVGALRLMPSDPAHPTPVVAGLRVDRTKNGKAEAAWLAGTDPIGARASIADNRGGGTNLYLTATGQDAKVRVTSSAGSGGGTPATQEVQIPAGATIAVDNPDPAGLNGVYGLTVETLSGGPVVAARMITVNSKDTQMFTIQELHDDHSTVRVPHTADDPGVLLRKR